MKSFNINITKSPGYVIPVDFDKLPEASQEAIVEAGIKYYLNNSSGNNGISLLDPKTGEKRTDWQKLVDQAKANANAMMTELLAGTVKTISRTRTTDPLEQVALEIAMRSVKDIPEHRKAGYSEIKRIAMAWLDTEEVGKAFRADAKRAIERAKTMAEQAKSIKIPAATVKATPAATPRAKEPATRRGRKAA